MNIHSNKLRIRMVIVGVALLLGTMSLYYTNVLVKKLAEREQKLIDLYAKGLENIATSDNTGNLTFLFQEIIQAKNSVPVILANSKGEPINSKNIDLPQGISKEEENRLLKLEIEKMKKSYPPIEIEYGPGLKNYVYYENSFLLTQLKYYPFIQLTVFMLFASLAYLSFNYSKNAEQNRVWVGMAKETAHQLGTPLSSLMAWVEIFKQGPRFTEDETVSELEKDVKRLETITARFSNIGSVPQLTQENMQEVIMASVGYLQRRLSGKVKFSIQSKMHTPPLAQVNVPLFDWVLENLCKNATDAMGGVGNIDIVLSEGEHNKLFIDVSDTGKGISKNQIDQVFSPGFTTKQRGWGLGLTLAKRIIENYHKGRIFVKQSEPGKGTTFRIVLEQSK